MTLHKDAILIHVSENGNLLYKYEVVDEPEWISEGSGSFLKVKLTTKYRHFFKRIKKLIQGFRHHDYCI